MTSSIWLHALERNDKVATKIIDEAIVALGAGIGSAVNLLDVEAVIIGGGLGVRFGEPFAKRIAAAMQPHLFNDENPPDVRVAAARGSRRSARCRIARSADAPLRRTPDAPHPRTP